MLVISKRIESQPEHDVALTLPFEVRQKSRLRTRSDDGEEVAVFLERGQVLRDGDCLEAEDGRIVRIVAHREKILQIACDTPQALLRVTYHLGNRHVPLQVGDGWVRIADDYVLKCMAEGLGAGVSPMEAPFEPEAGAYGGHYHQDGSPGHRGVIHEFRKNRAGSPPTEAK
jgi:urease accessory protein